MESRDNGIIKIQPKTKNETKKGEEITPIIGAPMKPSMRATSNLYDNSLLIASIIPCSPKFATGLTLFTLHSKMDEYRKRLREFGYEIAPGESLKVSFQADFTPSETFSNDYGESFLSKMTNVASEGISDLNQITGSKRGTEALEKLTKSGMNIAQGAGIKNPFISGLIEGANTKAKELNTWSKNQNGNTAGMVNAMLGGARIDFPQVWKNSAFSTNYSITIKLYNPNPANDKITDYFIIGPLTALLLLGLPSSQDEDKRAYNYPYFHQIKCRGLFELDQAAITSIQITKGTEGSIGFNQRLGLVEVRMDFIDLHAHMIGSSSNSPVPTLKKYIDILKEEHTIKSMYTDENTTNYKNDSQEDYDTKNSGPQPDTTSPPNERIDLEQKEDSDELISDNPKELAESPTITNTSLTPVAPPVISQMSDAIKQTQAIKADAAKIRSYGINLRALDVRAKQIAKARGL